MSHGQGSAAKFDSCTAGDGFFIDCLVCRLTATGAGGAKADVSARHVRTLIALESAIASQRFRVESGCNVELTR